MEDGEALDAALARELGEELGVIPTAWSYHARLEDRISYPAHPAAFHIYVVQDWQGHLINQGNEHTEIRWMGLDTALDLKDLALPAYRCLFQDLLQV